MKYELCDLCGEPTGRAGRSDDSLFLYGNKDAEVGPLCEECHDCLRRDDLEDEIARLEAQIAEFASLRAELATLFGAVTLHHGMSWTGCMLAQIGERLGGLEAENAELRAVVDKLPKCWRLDANGKLVQDVPVTPGMRLWDLHHDEPGIATLRGIYDYYPIRVNDWGGNVSGAECYSTREAAEAARKESV